MSSVWKASFKAGDNDPNKLIIDRQYAKVRAEKRLKHYDNSCVILILFEFLFVCLFIYHSFIYGYLRVACFSLSCKAL